MATNARLYDSDGLAHSPSNPVPVTVNNALLTLTPVVDTSAYTSGDVLFTDTELTGVAAETGGCATLQSVIVVDKDDETAVTIDLYFFDADVTFGAINGAPGPSDADMLKCVGRVNIPSTDFVDLGGAKMANVGNIGKVMKCAATSLWVAGVVTGTPTYTAAGDLQFKFGFENRS